MGIGGLGYKVKALKEGIGGSFKGHLGHIGHQHKVDMGKSNKERESCSPARFSVLQFEDLKSEELTLLTV